jgi:8-oxo-dGTP diphosphatase
LKVACAIIEKDGKILLVRRSQFMNLPGKWELPGGKIEANETLTGCIKREIREELGVKIKITEVLPVSITGQIELLPVRCFISKGSIALAEHDSFEWVNSDKYLEFDLAPADLPVLENYFRQYPGVIDIQKDRIQVPKQK